ncbi:hypothetical protein PHYPSEUDO_010787 [Phytophthora pseudosyringae]|uniref:Uncharacterized protein n=1 Tax=Phytophthora pseudosyringae TaxID=221518 RepID=A0A8T1WC45_9STRA|nr:hypothetical protein PHYPSEUDO_010787 [Phytophthora pseudosyringae]
MAPSPTHSNDENASDDDDDNFIARGERFGAVATEEATLQEDKFDLQRIWAKRRINSVTLTSCRSGTTKARVGGVAFFDEIGPRARASDFELAARCSSDRPPGRQVASVSAAFPSLIYN